MQKKLNLSVVIILTTLFALASCGTSKLTPQEKQEENLKRRQEARSKY